MSSFEYQRPLPAKDGGNLRAPFRTAFVLTLLFLAGVTIPPLSLFTHHEQYLPLHTVLEFVAMAISVMIFSLGWNVRKERESGYLPVLGGAFLAVALIDFAHTFSYPGMPRLITESSTEKAINFWLAGRCVTTLGLLALAFLPVRRRNRHRGPLISLLLGIGVALLVWYVVIYHPGLLPHTFIPGSGLTDFKIATEYLLVLLSMLAAGQFARVARRRRELPTAWLAAAAFTLGLSELYFTLYETVSDQMNLLGHAYKAAGYLMIYRALFVAGVRRPYQRLSAVRSHMQATLEAIPDLMIELDLTGRCLGLQVPEKHMLSLPAGELIGREIGELLPAGAAAGLRGALHEALQHGLSHGRQICLEQQHGVIWYELSVARKVQVGSVPRFIVLARDISEARQAEQTLRDSERRFRELVELSADWVWAVDERGVYTYASPRVMDLLGYKPEEVVGRTPFDFMPAQEAERVRRRFLGQVAHQQAFELQQNVNMHKDGRLVTLETSGMPIYDEQGRFRGYRGIDRDITDKQQAERELRIAAIAFESQEGMMVTDAQGTILRTNQAFSRITGYSADEVVGRNPDILKSDRHSDYFFRSLWQGLQNDRRWQGEIWNRRKDGQLFAAWLTISAVLGEDGEVVCYVAAFSDITQHKQSQQQIHQLAFFDPLTHLPNRRLFLDRLQQAVAASQRNGRNGGLLMLDLDHFKMVNDTLGHEAGDRLLLEVGRRLTACVRDTDTVARPGGDEFAVMLENLDADATMAAGEIEELATKIRDVLRRPYRLDGVVVSQFQGTASIGATLFRDQPQTTHELLKRVEVAMYRAKDDGRDALRFFSPGMQQAVEDRAALEADLRQAVRRDQLRLYYQAQVDSDDRICGVEGLLRWQHPQRGLVMPGVFIPLAEESSLILSLGQWVLETACAQLQAWEDDVATRRLPLSINISASQFGQADFVDLVRHQLDRHGIEPGRLKLELTESLVLDHVGESIDKMHQLKALGIAFSMDDFGTGYSSLAYLKRLPLDELKIDRSFVANLASGTNDEAIVQSIIALARTLHLDVIAEGVETVAQRRYLERNGCTRYQGFLYSRPVPREAFEQLLGKMPVSTTQ